MARPGRLLCRAGAAGGALGVEPLGEPLNEVGRARKRPLGEPVLRWGPYSLGVGRAVLRSYWASPHLLGVRRASTKRPGHFHSLARHCACSALPTSARSALLVKVSARQGALGFSHMSKTVQNRYSTHSTRARNPGSQCSVACLVKYNTLTHIARNLGKWMFVGLALRTRRILHGFCMNIETCHFNMLVFCTVLHGFCTWNKQLFCMTQTALANYKFLSVQNMQHK